jgi:hypothetical protein
MGAEQRRASLVEPPSYRKKKKDEDTGGSFFGGFSSGFMSRNAETSDDSYESWLNGLVKGLQAQTNTPENREALGQRTPEEIEKKRQADMRADFSAHIENGGTVKEFDYLKYQYGDDTIRNKPVSDKLIKDMSFLKEMGVQMVVYSGGQDAKGHGDRRTGSTRHDDGYAADAYFVDIKTGRILDWSNPKDQPIFKEIFYRGYQNGIQGWGAHKDYMGTKNVHLGYGTPAVWGAGGTGRPADWLWEAWNNARAGRIPDMAKLSNRTASLMTDTGGPKGLAHNESSDRWDATNDADGAGGKGHFGRVQFSRARLEEAKKAGAIPADMTPEQFLRDTDAQVAAEKWHFQDIRNFIKRRGLDRYIGQTINGVKVTMDGMIAVAHLGGQTGLLKHLTSGGTYNPSDSYIDKRTGQRVKGNTLSDYMRKHMA